jgi:hypothetical protein
MQKDIKQTKRHNPLGNANKKYPNSTRILKEKNRKKNSLGNVTQIMR